MDEGLEIFLRYAENPTIQQRKDLLHLLDVAVGQPSKNIYRRLLEAAEELPEDQHGAIVNLLNDAWDSRPCRISEGLRFYPFAFPVMVSLPLEYMGYHPSWQPAFESTVEMERRLAEVLRLPPDVPPRVFLYPRLLAPNTLERFREKGMHNYFRQIESEIHGFGGIERLPLIPVSDRDCHEPPAFLEGHDHLIFPRCIWGFVIAREPVVQNRMLIEQDQLLEERFLSLVRKMMQPICQEYPGSQVRLGPCVVDLSEATSTSLEWALGQSVLRRLTEDKIAPPAIITVEQEPGINGIELMFLFDAPQKEGRGDGVLFNIPQAYYRPDCLAPILAHLEDEGYTIASEIAKAKVYRLDVYRRAQAEEP